jgi:hypothetical protein
VKKMKVAGSGHEYEGTWTADDAALSGSGFDLTVNDVEVLLDAAVPMGAGIEAGSGSHLERRAAIGIPGPVEKQYLGSPQPDSVRLARLADDSLVGHLDSSRRTVPLASADVVVLSRVEVTLQVSWW